MHVVVVESPAKAKTIGRYLGDGYRVFASYGHVSDLPAKDGSVRPEDGFAMTYVTARRANRVLSRIRAALKDAESLILATDPDREGEAIAWQVLTWLQEKDAIGEKPVRRVDFHEITEHGVRDAMAHPRDLDMDLVRAQQARRALDYREARDEDAPDEDAEPRLPEMRAGETVSVGDVRSERRFTRPPPRYSEAGLVRALEERGIGRPSTYAAIVGVLRERDYVLMHDRRFVPTERGRVVTAFLQAFFGAYVAYGFTADLERTVQDRVAPVLTGAAVDGAVLTLTFSEALNQDSAPAAGSFAVTVADTARTVDGVALSQSAVELALASAVAAGETVTVGYTVPTGADAAPLQDAAGNDAASFAGEAADNETEASNAAPTGLPEISGTAQVGEELTASADDIADADGLENVTFVYQWLANDGTDDTEIEGATDATWTLTPAEAGKTLKVRVTFAAGMRMEDDKGGGAHLERADADLAGIDRGVVDRAGLKALVADQAILGIEVEDPEFLDVAVPCQRPAIVDDLLVGRELRMEALGQLGPGHTDAERLGGLDGGDAGLAESGDGAKRVGSRREDAGGGAEGVQQDAGEVAGVVGGVRSGEQEPEKLAVVDGFAPGAEKACAQIVECGIGGGGRCRGCGERGHVAEAGGGRIGEAHRPGLRSLATRPATMAGSAQQASAQPRKLRSKSSREPRWASNRQLSVVAARTELPETAMPVIAGLVIGSSSSSQERNAQNIGDRFSPRRGSMGCLAAGGGAGGATGIARAVLVSGMARLHVTEWKGRPAAAGETAAGR